MSKYLTRLVIALVAGLVVFALVNGVEIQKIIGAFGVVFVGYCWLNGKSITKMATEVGIKAGSTKLTQPAKPVPIEVPTADPDNAPLRGRAVFLYKRPRRDGDIKKDGTSWLGGLPALGDVAWPHDTVGRPMHHVMQINLSEAAPFLNVRGLPMHGSLAVFVSLGEDNANFETKVCYVKEPYGETTPPDALAPVGNHTYGGLSIHPTDPEALRTLPRWTVDLVQLTLEDQIDPEDDQILGEKLSAIKPLGTGMNVSAFTFADHLPNGQDPSFWHSAQIFAVSLARAARHLAGTRPAERASFLDDTGALTGLISELETRAAHIAKWASAYDPWDVMSPTDLDVFKIQFAPFQHGREASQLGRAYHNMPGNFGALTHLADATLKEMVRGPDKVFKRLPEAIQNAVDEDHLTPRVPHQLFGPPTWIQDAAAFHEPDHLLFQIVHDSVIGLELAAGHIQVWISPDDLAAQNWDAITSIFECS